MLDAGKYEKILVSLILTGGVYCNLMEWSGVHITVGQLVETEWCICASVNSNNGSSPGRRHAILWTNAGILLIGANTN